MARRWPRRIVVLFVGALGLAALALVARATLFSVLRVPTDSMEPTLHGDPERGDEILVLNPWYRFAAPRRFELALFERDDPAAGSAVRLQVKRIGALPGETVRIEDGELFVRAPGGDREELVRKDYAQFRPLLIPIWTGGAAGPRLALDPREVPFDDGWIDAANVRHPGREPVRDLLLDLDLRVTEPTACCVVRIERNADRLEAELRLARGGSSCTLRQTQKTSGGGTTRIGLGDRFAPGTRLRFEFWQVDGAMGAALDGEPILAHVLAPLPREIVEGSELLGLLVTGASAATATLSGPEPLEGLEIVGATLFRDLHYTRLPEQRFALADRPFTVPEGELFLLGDHSAASQDSRLFGSVPIARLVGRPLLILAPEGRRRLLR